MTKKVPIWLIDQYGYRYHAKKDAEGALYIVDAVMNKRLTITNLEHKSVGAVIDYPLFYNTYTVIENLLLPERNEVSS